MKAILVINMPKGYGKITDNIATINLKNWKLDTSLYICNVPLKPLPQKRELEESGNSLIDDCKEYYTDGWNDCLNEILGEDNG